MENNYIKIQGSVVQLVEERVAKTVALSSYLDNLSAQQTLQTPILPHGCRFYSHSEQGNVFVIEEPPRIRVLEWNNMEGCKRLVVTRTTHTTERAAGWAPEPNMWKLAFPFCVFVVKVAPSGAIENSFLFYRKAPLQGLDDMLLRPNLGNLWSAPIGRICFGSNTIDPALTSLADKVDALVTLFWKSPFNEELCDLFCSYQGEEKVKSLLAWQAASAENPLFPLEMPWTNAATLRVVIMGERR